MLLFLMVMVMVPKESLNESSIPDDAFYEKYQEDDNVLFEGYLVYSTKRKNLSHRKR